MRCRVPLRVPVANQYADRSTEGSDTGFAFFQGYRQALSRSQLSLHVPREQAISER